MISLMNIKMITFHFYLLLFIQG